MSRDCRYCGYDLRGSEAVDEGSHVTCPECGGQVVLGGVTKVRTPRPRKPLGLILLLIIFAPPTAFFWLNGFLVAAIACSVLVCLGLIAWWKGL